MDSLAADHAIAIAGDAWSTPSIERVGSAQGAVTPIAFMANNGAGTLLCMRALLFMGRASTVRAWASIMFSGVRLFLSLTSRA